MGPMRPRGKLMSARTSPRAMLAAAGVVVIASIARADAPSGPGGQYGLFDSNNTVIYDEFTRLTWQRAVPPKEYVFGDAANYCAGLSLGSLPSGWRLPSYKELLTIVDESPHPEYDPATGSLVYKAIDSHAFGVTLLGGSLTPTSAPYWSSSPYLAIPKSVYTVEFTTGATVPLLTGVSTLVRCVHD